MSVQQVPVRDAKTQGDRAKNKALVTSSGDAVQQRDYGPQNCLDGLPRGDLNHFRTNATIMRKTYG